MKHYQSLSTGQIIRHSSKYQLARVYDPNTKVCIGTMYEITNEELEKQIREGICIEIEDPS